jgi:hypothetical protein
MYTIIRNDDIDNDDACTYKGFKSLWTIYNQISTLHIDQHQTNLHDKQRSNIYISNYISHEHLYIYIEGGRDTILFKNLFLNTTEYDTNDILITNGTNLRTLKNIKTFR